MIPKVMPRIYKWMLTMSSMVFLIFAWEDGRGPTWGKYEQVFMLIAGLFTLYVAWRPSRKCNIIASYSVTVAVLFEITAHLVQRHPNAPWVTAVTMWVVLGTYTVLLISFAWIRKTP